MTDSAAQDDREQTLVFIGDSITAADRDGADPNDLGRGFVAFIADDLRRRLPDSSFGVINRGVGGDRAADVEARWESDCLALAPDVITLLVGVNDTWRQFDRGQENPVAEYEKDLRRMVASARDRTTADLVLVEPFILEVGFVTDRWREDLAERREAVARVARDAGASLVSTQYAFDGAAGADPAALLYDGVHPTAAGHHLLAERWLAERPVTVGGS
ncbi:MAG: SGNH/GDSL hydrolase family protein [Microbacterium sp.]